MKPHWILVPLLTALALAAAALAADEPAPEPDAAETCRAACGRLAGALQKELRRAMAEGGPLAAVRVCNELAPAVADSLSRELGLRVGRTSLRVRNPANAPDAWERSVLEDFARRAAEGEKPGSLEQFATVDKDDGRVFRYMKGIGTIGVCLRCHGDGLDGELAARIGELYPEDEAVGFAAGDLRGAFTVSLPLDD